jgi:hypothetical protein
MWLKFYGVKFFCLVCPWKVFFHITCSQKHKYLNAILNAPPMGKKLKFKKVLFGWDASVGSLRERALPQGRANLVGWTLTDSLATRRARKSQPHLRICWSIINRKFAHRQVGKTTLQKRTLLQDSSFWGVLAISITILFQKPVRKNLPLFPQKEYTPVELRDRMLLHLNFPPSFLILSPASFFPHHTRMSWLNLHLTW